MSINGLRFSQERHSSAPLETKSGSYIYAGDAANFHDWQFRTLLRIRLYEQKLEETSKSADPVGTTATEPAAEDSQEYATFPDLSGATQATQPTSAASTPKSGASRKSSKSGKQKTDVDRGPLVNKVIEGLRGDAFSIARDLGLEVLSEPGGLVKLVGEIKSHVFPRAREEAKELFRAGQKQGGPLSRQPGEPMLSYVQRRRRWWHMLCELDDTMVFSDSLRTELMLELSGLNRQEILVVKACADTKDFEGVGKVLIENYSGTHLREGSRSWTGRGNPQQLGKSTGKGYGKGKPSSKGSYSQAAYAAYPDDGEDHAESWDEVVNQSWEDDSYVGLLGDIAEEEPGNLEGDNEFDYSHDVDEYEAVALNSLLELEGAEDDRQAGDAIQLQLAAFTAMGKAGGKGKSFGKPKGKGKGKIVKSNLTIDQRRRKLTELKSKSKCLRCGVIGHWAGDPECKFPGSKSGAPGKPAPKPAAHFADMSDSSDDDGVTLTASPDRDRDAVAMMAVRQAKPSSRPSRAAASSSNVGLISRDLDVTMRPEDHGCIFPVGQFKGLSFWNVLFEQTGYYHHAKKHTPKSPYYATWLNWVDKYFVVGADGIHLREVPVEHVEHRDLLVTRETGRRKPPNPPLPNKCQECREFTKQGSTGYTIRKTCLVCGHSETTRRDMVPLMTPENCPHDDTDFRGSSKSTHRTFCKKCCTFIEAPMQIRKERVAIAKKVETASVRAVPIVESLVEESDGLNPVQLEELLPLFATLVTETCQSEVMTRARLHELLHQAINDVTEEEDSFSLINDDGHGDPSGRELAGYVGICLHGSDIQYPQDLVYMNFETVDIARSPHVFAVLDEGCNSTCHSKAWAVDAEARLARLGYSMPLKDDSCKSFAGLGSGNTKTEGVRSIPFSLLLPDGNMNGELDSYQLSTGNSPLLFSLHAQTKLGLVKDLAKGVVSIQDQPLKIKRCSKSGLLVMNLTEGLTDIINTPPNELPKIPKCHRKYNLAYTASTSDSAMADHDQTGFHSRDYDVLQSKLNEEQLSNRQVIIVTRGRRFQRHAMRSNRATLSINCEDIYDPDQDVSLRAHVGWHHRILETLSKVDKFNEHLNSILEFVTQHQEERILVDLECKSGRHRSVGEGFAAFRCLKALGYDVVLIHSSSWMWGEMRCGGVCNDCKNVGASVGQIRQLIPRTQAVTMRPRGSVAASRAGVGDAPADGASVEHPTTNQIEEIRRLVQGLASDVGGLASDVGHLRSEQRKIAAERRSRSPLRRRRLPTPPSPQDADEARATVASCPHGDIQDHPEGGAWEEIEAHPRDQLHQSQFLRDLLPGVQITHLHIFQMCQGPMKDPDRHCHDVPESPQMIAMSLSDWFATTWHWMDRSTTRTYQWHHWTVNFLVRLCPSVFVREIVTDSFGSADLELKTLTTAVSGWMSWFEITSDPIESSRLRTASSIGNDLRGADLAMEALGSSSKTMSMAIQWCVWTTRGLTWSCFTTHQGCSMTPGGEHTWAFTSSWPPTRNFGM